jgi:Secretion system C-terminal sorting domain
MKTYKIGFLTLSILYMTAHGEKILPRFWDDNKNAGGTMIFADNPSIKVDGMQNIDIEVQSIEISTYSTNPGMNGISLQFKVYPNPFKEFLILKIEGDNPTDYSASIYDTNGRELLTKKVVSDETTFSTTNLTPATYLLKVIQLQDKSPRKIVKIFKVIKK